MSSNLFELAKIMTNKAKGKNSISKDEFDRVKKKFSLLTKDLPKVVNSNNSNKQEMIDNILTIEFDRDHITETVSINSPPQTTQTCRTSCCLKD